jgi:cysteine desulfurase
VVNRMIYLDHNATTPPHPDVVETVARLSRDAFANPGSRHAGGRQARRVLEQSREIVAQALRAQPDEIHFASGGTEANHLAIFGMSRGRSGAFLSVDGEHPSLAEPYRRLVAEGWSRHTLPLDSSGLPILDGSLKDLPPTTGFAALQWAHNETGVIRDPRPLAEWCRSRQIPLHLDAVQAVGRIDVDFEASGATSLSLAGHKFRGPRGIGTLVVRRGVKLAPVIFGGHQENGLRPGTECTALAAGMARALELWNDEKALLSRHWRQLRDQLERGILAAIPGTFVHAATADRLPNTSNIAFPMCDGEALLVALDLAGVCASLGSACASGSAEPAPVLLAMGVPAHIARSSLRFSVGWTNTAGEIDNAVRIIAQTIHHLRA